MPKVQAAPAIDKAIYKNSKSKASANLLANETKTLSNLPNQMGVSKTANAAIATTPPSASPQDAISDSSKATTALTVPQTDTTQTSLLPSEAKPAYDLIVTILKAVERTHGYLSKTLLSQHLSGVESKAVQGLRLQRLPEFGILKDWKKSHASGFLDQTLDVGLLCLSELRVGKLTVSISETGNACIAGTQPIPGPLMQYVNQCIVAAEKMAEQANERAATDKPAVRNDGLPARTVETPALTSPKTLPVSRNSSSSTVATPVPVNENATPSSDALVRPLAHLPSAEATDASSGRDVTAPMIEDWRWTVRLVEHGYRLGECALIRGKTPDSILEDLTKALQDGKRFTIGQLFDRRTQIAVKELRDHFDREASPPSIFQSYPSLWRFIQRWIEMDSR